MLQINQLMIKVYYLYTFFVFAKTTNCVLCMDFDCVLMIKFFSSGKLVELDKLVTVVAPPEDVKPIRDAEKAEAGPTTGRSVFV